MIQENFDTLVTAARGRALCATAAPVIRGYFTDTRQPVRGGLFVALRGENFDGNGYAREAAERHGAAAVLIDREQAANHLPAGVGAILVDDARLGFLGIAAAHRKKLSNCLWLAVTGSVGKSSTKEMLAHILSVALPERKLQKALGSFNNEIGVSKTILECGPGTELAVLELGTNHPGEIGRLAAAACPQVALITRAAEAHLEAFGSVENIAREKGAILNFQSANDTAVLNADDPFFELWKSMARGRVVSFSVSKAADLRALNVELNAAGCPRFTLSCKISGSPERRLVDCELNVPGTHQVSNALAAMAAAGAAGVAAESAAIALRAFTGLARRFTIHAQYGITLIDDAYNANPASFAAALETLQAIPARRRFVAAGGMLELGAQSAARHRALGEALAGLKLAGLALVGPLARSIGEGALENGFAPVAIDYFDAPEEAATALAAKLRPGDALLVKGSHGIRLDICVERLRGLLK